MDERNDYASLVTGNRKKCNHENISMVTETNPSFITKRRFVECQDCNEVLPIFNIIQEERQTIGHIAGTINHGVRVSPITLSGWISIEDRLPEMGVDVLCLSRYDSRPWVDLRSQYDNGNWIRPYKRLYPDYWLPFTVKLPE